MESFEEYFYGLHLFETIEVGESGSLKIRFKPEVVEQMLITEDSDGATASDLVKGVDKHSRKRSKDIDHTFVDIKDNGLLVYKTSSGTRKDGKKYYTQFIKLTELDKYLYDQSDAPMRERIKLALLGEIEVYCDCPAFLYYGFSYMASGLGYKYGNKEGRFPKVRNPNTEGSVCKHLYAILKRFNVQDGKVVQAINNKMKDRE